MGAKRSLLRNGLGRLVKQQARSAERVVDLFCGAGSVSWYAATHLDMPVLACDLQAYAVVLAGSVIERTRALPPETLERSWLAEARRRRERMPQWSAARRLDEEAADVRGWKARAEEMCGGPPARDDLLIWDRYGGYYFSPTQALTFDALLGALPRSEESRDLCLAATLIAASRCAAAPGHTAQPFKATGGAGPYLRTAWRRDPLGHAARALRDLGSRYARRRGETIGGDANLVARNLKASDLVFVDPPYASVQYSRFYHVLETMARGRCGPVEGAGRYPPPSERPNSRYSRRGRSEGAVADLLQVLADRGCTVILTFPRGDCSNGLSGERIEELAADRFRVSRDSAVRTTFSTLGGNGTNRTARKVSDELVLLLSPRAG